MAFLLGISGILVGGFLAGGATAPIKLLKKYQYEHWSLIAVSLGFVLFPWSLIALTVDVPKLFSILPVQTLLLANLLSMCWGIANILASLCLIRIGFSLTIGLLTGVGLPLGVLVPLIFHGEGMSAGAPELFSTTGLVMLIGVGMAVCGICFISRAGLLKSKEHAHLNSGKAFRRGLAMAALAGVLQVGLSLSMVYSQPVIEQALLELQVDHIVIVGVTCSAMAMMGGVLLNLLYPLWVLYRKDSWRIFGQNAPREIGWVMLIAVGSFIFPVLIILGMKELGPLGPSVGFGIYQSVQLGASQLVGIVGGEWHGASLPARRNLACALLLLLLAVVIFAAGRAF